MRVAFVAHETVRHGDTEARRRLQRVARLFHERGHEVTVLCSQWWTGPGDRREVDGVPHLGITIDPAATRSFCFRLPFAIRKLNPDVVHAMGRPATGLVAAAAGASMARAPLIAEWYDTDFETAPTRAIRAPDRNVVPSRLVRRHLMELGADAETLSVLPTSVSFDRIRSVDPEDRGNIVYARRLDEGANLESLLLALAELRTMDWSAVVIGDGPAREEYEQQARDLRIADRVTFAGDLDLDERIAVYRGAHVFAQTASQCRFATELLWAMACGCVGIVEYHAESSAHELVENAERGFRTTSEEELTEAIREAADLDRLVVDESFAEYDDEPVLQEYLDCYRRLREDRGLF